MRQLMDDEMSTSMGPGVNSYVNVDSVIDFVRSIGMDVLFEIGFMPEWLASKDTHVFHYNGNTSPVQRRHTPWTHQPICGPVHRVSCASHRCSRATTRRGRK